MKMVAGETKEFEEGLTVQKLIEIEDVETPEYVTVSVNEEFLKKEEMRVDSTLSNSPERSRKMRTEISVG